VLLRRNVYAVHMMLEGQVAVVHGAGGAIGRAVSDAFERAGAQVFRASRRARPGVDSVHAMDRSEVEAHAASVVRRTGHIDIAFNAVAVEGVRGVALLDLGHDDLLTPILRCTRAQFLTSTAAARHMVARGTGTVLTLSAARTPLHAEGVGGFGPACAAIEQLTRALAAELAPSGVRAVCLRAHGVGTPAGVARVALAAAAADGARSTLGPVIDLGAPPRGGRIA
jgi:3-oxoacyl-[acyl-carrier protein] reductase